MHLFYHDFLLGWFFCQQLQDVRNRRISALSKGYKQRVGIAQALLGNPKVIILDEPTVGLDPVQIIEIRELIHQLGQTHTVILSSHILSEVQTMCEKILIIAHGKLIAFDTPENLERQLLAPGEITLLAEASVEETAEILAGMEHITETHMAPQDSRTVTVRLQADLRDIHDLSRALFFAFAKQGRPLLEMSMKRANLEDIFIELTEQAEETPADSEEAQA